MEKFYNNTWKRVVEFLNSDQAQGLKEDNCRLLRRKYGTNDIELLRNNKIYKYITSVLGQKSILINIIILIILFLFNYVLFGLIVSFFTVLNIAVILYRVSKKNKEFSYVQGLIDVESSVIRDGLEKIIQSKDLVIGDIVRIKSGDIIPADIRIISSNELKVDEKDVTGEEVLIEKNEEQILGTVSSISEIHNILFKGSKVVSGEGKGIVIATGGFTQIGKNIAMMTYSNSRKHNFGAMVSFSFEKYLITYFIGALIIASTTFLSGKSYAENHAAVCLLILGCIPSFLIAFLGFKIVISNLKAEDIGIINFSVFNLIQDINILFFDKIGALSKEEMNIKHFYLNNQIISTEDSYLKEITFDRMMEITLLCNDSVYDPDKGIEEGDIDGLAFLKYAYRKKINKPKNKSKIIEIPQDGDKRFLTVVNRVNRGCRANSRGNVDSILEHCTHIMIDGVERELTDEYRNKIKAIDMNFSINGLITQAAAYRNFNYQPSKSENIESNMVFVGIIALENQFEDSMQDTIKFMRDRSIVPILFTEESKLSAITNAKRSHLIKNSNQVVAGIELDSLNQDELREVIGRVRVFCRVTPEIKSKIISIFIKDGYKVATAGETMGDLPALNLSSVGISKNKANNIVKKISDVYIKDNYLNGFFKVREYGKILHKNINNLLKTYFMTLLSEILVLLFSIVMGTENSISLSGAVIMSGLMFIPLSLVILSRNGRRISRLEMISRAILLSGITIISIYGIDDKQSSIIPVIIISFGTILFTMFNNKLSIKSFSKELRLSLSSMFIVIIGCIIDIIIKGIVFRDIIIIEIISSIVFLLIFEILYGKWKDSLMR